MVSAEGKYDAKWVTEDYISFSCSGWVDHSTSHEAVISIVYIYTHFLFDLVATKIFILKSCNSTKSGLEYNFGTSWIRKLELEITSQSGSKLYTRGEVKWGFMKLDHQ